MNNFTVGHVTVQVVEGASEYVGKPDQDTPEMTGSAQLAHLSTPDGLAMTMGVVTWPDRDGADVSMVDFETGPEPYRRLERAGTMNLKTIDGLWVARVTAMKINGRSYPTGNRVTWGEVDWLAGGIDTTALLMSLGATHLGTYESVCPGAAARHKMDSGLSCPAGMVAPIAAIYALTRVEAIMQQLGVNGPKAIN
jgi:hypothetical protein